MIALVLKGRLEAFVYLLEKYDVREGGLVGSRRDRRRLFAVAELA